ncbi:MAG TPA: ERF family protein [Dehalococcoidia bacterium]|nr:ERF family protein [Dehalococcoidia bacterium]
MEKSESIKELAIALNKAQATLQVAKKGSENPFFHSKYADLLSIWDACREALTSNGLSIAQIADTDLEGKAVLETILMHTSGEWIMGRLPLSTTKTDPQGQGSAITYARRYSLSAIIGLCTEPDDDAEGAMNREKSKEKTKGHWCSIHKTPFFKKGRMKAYAHPIKEADLVTDSGEWCNEMTESEEPDRLDVATPSKPNIDMAWLKESLEELNWADVSKWMKKKYPKATGTSIKGLVESLTREQQEEFVKEVQKRLEAASSSEGLLFPEIE